MAPTLRNPARARLEAGELALGVGIRQSRTVDIATIMKACGYDWLFLDLEHNSMDLDTAVQISVAALDAGIAPIARVPAGQIGWPHAFSTVAASASSCRMSTPPRRRARSRTVCAIRRAATVRSPADCHISAIPDQHRRRRRRNRRRDTGRRHARNTEGNRQCRRHRRGARHRFLADRNQRFVDRARHSGPVRGRADRRRL